jgi:hypothetical protein
MEIRSEGIRLRFWFVRLCSSIVLWICFVQLVTVSELWHSHLFSGITTGIYNIAQIQLPKQLDYGGVDQLPPTTFLPPS